MNRGKKNFDVEAASWDDNPARIKLARDVAEAISKQITLTSDMDLLDFGCGTGLLTFHLQPFVHSITGADTSAGMLDLFKAKIEAQHLANVKALLLEPDKGDTLAGSYHQVVSNMTLHHVKEIKPLLDQFYKIITPAGFLCIADLDPDDGRFHDDNTGVFHFGFDRTMLRGAFIKAGFDNVWNVTATEVVKPSLNGEMRRFTIFLMTGCKNSHK